MLTIQTLSHALRPWMDGSSVIVVHAACRSLGAIEGRADGVLEALMQAVGDRTLVVPSFTPQLVDPACWLEAGTPIETLICMRDAMPSFDRWTPPNGVGSLPAALTRHAAAVRSTHPVESVAAWGPLASWVVSAHPLDEPWGSRSPWARLTECDARILLIGVDLSRCSIIHHAERLAEPPYLERWRYAAPIDIDGNRHWIEAQGGSGCTSGFTKLEALLSAKGALQLATVGASTVRVLRARLTVELAVEALRRDSSALSCAATRCPVCADTEADLPCNGETRGVRDTGELER